ncbi:hypothetical protein [uncultured Anaerococcus sp.]|uniref:hypothetical protein n=1 Tax=uncultured Anaerococcus sp. TaxID=293428 RepID=UPI00288A5498|nr:hypothetical protein [uncultured Anaerococcus sp.]
MRLIDILENEEWIRKYDFYEEFMKSSYYKYLIDSYNKLNREILFKSHIHGPDHIERVIFFSHLLAFLNELDFYDLDVLRNAASLHDTKRRDDSYDPGHGPRAAIESISYSYARDEDRKIIQAVIAAHSPEDRAMEKIITNFIGPEDDFERAMFLAKLFKDADALDRVRINHLDPKYLRNSHSKDLVDLAYDLYEHF